MSWQVPKKITKLLTKIGLKGTLRQSIRYSTANDQMPCPLSMIQITSFRLMKIKLSLHIMMERRHSGVFDLLEKAKPILLR